MKRAQGKNAQGSLEYLIIIAAVLAVAAIVVLFLTGAFGSTSSSANVAKCKEAAARCATEWATSVNPLCSYCDVDCPAELVGKCKAGAALNISALECKVDVDCNDSNVCTNDACSNGYCFFENKADGVSCGVDDDCNQYSCKAGACNRSILTGQFCGAGDPYTCREDGACSACVDDDGDGYSVYNAVFCPLGNDCNDNIPGVNPAAAEVCGNCVDDNCNGKIDCEDTACSSDASCESGWDSLLYSSTMGNVVKEINSSGSVIYSKIIPQPTDSKRLINGNTLIASSFIGFSSGDVVECTPAGAEVWYIHGGAPFDVDVFENGNLLIAVELLNKVIEVNSSKETVWNYTATNGPADVDILSDGNILITEWVGGRVMVVNKTSKEVLWTYNCGYAACTDADRLENGNTLITYKQGEYVFNGITYDVIEVDKDKNFVWGFYSAGSPFDSERLVNGNTIMVLFSKNKIIEVNKCGNIVYEYPVVGPMSVYVIKSP